MNKRIRVLLIDDHELYRNGLRKMLEAEDDVEVVGDCASAEAAFPQTVRLSPDILLMDVQMPGMSGIDATRHLKRNGTHCDAAVVLLADGGNHLIKALEAGAAAYLQKDVRGAELVETIKQVYESERSVEEQDGSVDETVELVIPAPASVAQTLRFIGQVEKKLDVSVVRTVGSWDGSTAITILPKPAQRLTLLDGLKDMPDVDKVQEGSMAGDGFLNPFRILSKLRGSARKRIFVTLKQPDMVTAPARTGIATQRLAPALS